MARMAIGADEKKKLMILGGLLAAIGVVVAVLYIPRGGGAAPDTTTPATTEPGPQAAAPEGPSPDAGGPASAAGGGGAPGGITPGGITAASLISVERYRSDPFEPYPVPPPLPTPPPPPPPPPPVAIPSPMETSFDAPDASLGLPPMSVGGSAARPLADLPPLRQTRIASAPTAPRNYLPTGGQGSSAISRSLNKRLSGVVIGDSVRALLEITAGETVTTRVVQPGDEVDGIRVLRLERAVEAGRTVTRLVVRENGQEQSVELRPAPQDAGGGPGGFGGSGSPSRPGGFGGPGGGATRPAF